MHVCVGSGNPTKVEAVRLAFTPHFHNVTIRPIELPSPVSAQPMGDEETRRGAALRAQRALAHDRATFGVGIEGGVDLGAKGGAAVITWCGIAHADGRLSCAPGQPVPLPPRIVPLLKSGKELRDTLGALPERRHTEAGDGLIGILTNGALTRLELTRIIVATTLVPFLHPSWFNDLRHDEPRS